MQTDDREDAGRISIIGRSMILDSLMKAFGLDSLGEFDGAIKTFDEAIRSDPDEVGGHCGKGLALFRLEKYAEAVECFDRAIQLDSNDLCSCYGKGLVLLRLERYDLAIKYFNRVIRSDPGLALVHYNKGLALMGIGGYRKAVLSFGRAIELDPEMALAHYNRGVAWVRRERATKAMECFGEVIRIGSWPMVLSAHCIRGLILVSSGRNEDAIAYCDHLISVYPKMAEMHYNKGCLLLHAGLYKDERNICCVIDDESGRKPRPPREYGRAVKCFEEAIKLDPDMSEANYGKGLALLAAGKNHKAAMYFEMAAKMDPDMSEANYKDMEECLNKEPSSNLGAYYDPRGVIPLPWLCSGEIYGDHKLRLHCAMRPNVWLRCPMTVWPGTDLRIRNHPWCDEWARPVPDAARQTSSHSVIGPHEL